MESDVKSVRITATGTVVSGRTRVRSIYFIAGAAAGTIILRDGGAGGTTKLTVDTPALATWVQQLDLPDHGIVFATDVHATMSAATGLTVIYG